jgi:hypothetical protein
MVLLKDVAEAKPISSGIQLVDEDPIYLKGRRYN